MPNISIDAVRVNITVSFSLSLEAAEWFIEPGFRSDPDIQIRSVHGYLDTHDALRVSGRGKQMLKAGGVGLADRNAYSVNALPDPIRDRILVAAKSAVTKHAVEVADL